MADLECSSATSRGYHGPVRRCVDRAWPTAEHAGTLRGPRRVGANLAGMLHRILGHESDPISSIEAAEQGSLSLAPCRSGNRKRRRDCSKLRILGAWTFRRALPYHLRRNALVHAAAGAGRIDVNLPELHSAREASCDNPAK